MAATTGPLSTCSSPVLFLIAREWQRNKHLHRILFTESLLNPDKVFYMRGLVGISGDSVIHAKSF